MMESVAISFLSKAFPFRVKTFPSKSPTGYSPFLPIRSKQSDFHDFRDYAKPARLLRAAEIKVCTDNLAENVLAHIGNDESRSLYKVKLGTSNFSASSLSDSNAGVLLCLIDENGDSILQRISAGLVGYHYADSDDDDLLQFQKGSVEEFTFEGPKLGRVEAIWIGVESGYWRLGSVSLSVLNGCQQSLKERDREEIQYTGFTYEFEAEDILLGEGTNVSMLEFRPCRVTELSGVDASTLFTRSLLEPTSLASQRVSNEESMREYADLKLSLLVYDASLICIGTSATSFTAGERAALAFLTGGVVGFLYLLLLQRSVDGISAPESSYKNTGETERTFGGFKGPISSLALAIGFTLFAVKYNSADLTMVLTPKELIVGMMGFLACKVAVLLAAFRP